MAGPLGFWLLLPLQALLRQPILALELGVLAGVLVFSLGRSMGAPLQFFHEQRPRQAWAGFAATLAWTDLFFVMYLAEADDLPGLAAPLAAWFVASWLVVLLAATTLRIIARRAPDKLSERLHLSSALRGVETQTAELKAPGFPAISPWPFVAGSGVAGALLALGAGLLHARLEQLDAALYSLLSALGHSGAAHAGLHVVALVPALLAGGQLLVLRARASAAGAFCSLLVLIATAIGASDYWFEASSVVWLAVLLLAWRAGREHYAIRIPDLAPLYERGRRVAYPPRPRERSAPSAEPALADALIDPRARPSKRERQPLILLCASGGGIRAATWTAGLLARLSAEVPRFNELSLTISGASGGMVGAAYFIADLKRCAESGERLPLSFPALSYLVSRDSLTELTRALVLHDLPRALLGGVNTGDRGAALQRAWETRAAELRLDTKLVDFAPGEREGRWPSLIFSPMVVEDGRRLLLSNLELPGLTDARALWVEDVDSERVRLASQSAFHAAELFGEAARDVQLGTAARLSASFPYISPAVVLPTEPRTRVVDAGYYDNFGVDLCSALLRRALEHHADWLEQNVSRILILQMRDDVSVLSQPSGAPLALSAKSSALSRGLEGLTTPVEGFFAARSSVMQLRNDAQLDGVAASYAARFGRDFLAHEIFELKGDVSLSWYLAESEYQKILGQLEAVGAKIRKLEHWLSRDYSR